MWSPTVKLAAIALGFVALSNVSVSAQMTSTTTTTTTNGSSSSTTTTTTTCEVGGLKVSNNFRYVAGRKGVEGSIYATCTTDNKPECFIDTRVRDAATAESISCADEVIHESRRRLGVYMSSADHYWPQGVACYSYGSAFTAAQQTVFANAMDTYHQNTAVRFVTLDECKAKYPTACGGCTQKFQIVNAAGASDCYATLGYAPDSRMDLNFGSGCFNGDGGFRVAVHELGHVIGLIHEHTHPNRQVVVLRSDLTLSPDNYMKERNGATTAYDSGSVMHYSRETGICIPANKNTVYCDIDQTESDGCVVPTADMCDTAADALFGKATTLAASDIATIAKIYGSGGGGQVPPTPAPSVPATSAPVPMPPATQAPSSATPVVSPVATPAPSVPAPEPTSVPVPGTTQQPVVISTPGVTTTDAPVDQTTTDGNKPSSSWDNMNQQAIITYPVTDDQTSAGRTNDDATDDGVAAAATDDNSEVRGAAVPGNLPVQVLPPASLAPTPAAAVVSSSDKTKKPRICDY